MIFKRPMRWLGHIHHLPQGPPANTAIQYAEQGCKRSRGRPKSIWIATIRKRIEYMIVSREKRNKLPRIEELGKNYHYVCDIMQIY